MRLASLAVKHQPMVAAVGVAFRCAGFDGLFQVALVSVDFLVAYFGRRGLDPNLATIASNNTGLWKLAVYLGSDLRSRSGPSRQFGRMD